MVNTPWDRPIRQEQTTKKNPLGRGLGWFSIGLGVAELMAPRAVARWIGVRGNHDVLIPLLGAREILSGIAILSPNNPRPGLWARVGGDALDLALLGTAFTSPEADKTRLTTATVAVAGVTALDIVTARKPSARSRSHGNASSPGTREVKQSVTIDRSSEDLYRFWRDFRNLPRFMRHLESVQVSGDSSPHERSHWLVKGPAGMKLEWGAEITQDQPGRLIAWRSLEGADVQHSGRVHFEDDPGGRGTLVSVEMRYDPPGGSLGSAVAKLFGEDPRWLVRDSLRRFKQVMEAGEVITTEGQPAARRDSQSWRYDLAA